MYWYPLVLDSPPRDKATLVTMHLLYFIISDFLYLIITVRTLTRKMTFPLVGKPSDTIGTIKAKIHEKKGILLVQPRLIYAGKQFEDEHTLIDYIVKDTRVLTLIEGNHLQCNLHCTWSVIELSACTLWLSAGYLLLSMQPMRALCLCVPC